MINSSILLSVTTFAYMFCSIFTSPVWFSAILPC